MLAALARLALPAWVRATAPPRSAAAIAEAQAGIRARLVARGAKRAVGRRMRLPLVAASSDPARAFRRLVPITEYADYADLIERTADGERGLLFPGRALALAQTSGTTRAADSGERWIPQAAALLRHHRRGGATALARALQEAGPELLDGRLLMLGGSTRLDHARAVPSGDLSGIAASRVPAWLCSRQEPPQTIAALPNWDTRLAAIVARCAGMDVRLLAGIPSWMLVLLREIAQQRGVSRADRAWPGLRMVIHGGHAIEPMVEALRGHLADDQGMLEVYPASEAFIAVGERTWRLGEGAPPPLELLTDHGVYLEFCPEGGDGADAVGAEALEPGGVYRVLVTTPGGLVRYQIGDLVRAEGPGRVRFAGRIRARISVFGEHVEGIELARAIAGASTDRAAAVAHYHVAPILPTIAEPRGAHQWLIEFERAPDDLGAFAAALDGHLRRQVLDYDAHRRDDGQLLPPSVVALPRGCFAAYLASRGRCDAQRKVPQAWPDRTIADHLLAAAARSEPDQRGTP
jgi:hypothetical protein